MTDKFAWTCFWSQWRVGSFRCVQSAIFQSLLWALGLSFLSLSFPSDLLSPARPIRLPRALTVHCPCKYPPIPPLAWTVPLRRCGGIHQESVPRFSRAALDRAAPYPRPYSRSFSTLRPKSSPRRPTPIVTLWLPPATTTATNVQPTCSSNDPNLWASPQKTRQLQWIIQQSQCLDGFHKTLPHDQQNRHWRKEHGLCSILYEGRISRYLAIQEHGLPSRPTSKHRLSTSMWRMKLLHGSPPLPLQRTSHSKTISPNSKTTLPSAK